MLNDLFITIAAGMISVLPVQPAPAVIVTASDIESSVVQEISGAEERRVSIDCNFDFKELSLKDGEKRNFTCFTTDTTNKQVFSTTVIVKAKKDTVTVSAIVGSPQSSTPEKPTTDKDKEK